MSPVIRDDCYRTRYMTPMRERRLLQMAAQAGFNHKAFYGQYCYLQRRGFTGWQIGMAYLLPDGVERLAALIEQGA